MSLATQISVIGSLPSAGSVAGGSATTDAGDLTTGTLAAARLPGVLAGVDTQPELLAAAAAAAASHTHAASDIASGTVATARLGSGTANSTTFLRGDQTWAAPSDATKLPLAGGTLTGALSLSSTGILMTGTHTPAAGDRCLTNWGGGNDIGLQAPTAGSVNAWIQGNAKWSVGASNSTSWNPITINQCARPSTSTVNISTDNQTNRFTMHVPSGGLIAGQVGGNGVFYADNTVFRTYADLSVDNSGGTQQATLGASGLTFPTAHSTPGGNAVYRSSANTTTLQAPGTGYVSITCNQSNPPRIFVGGASAGSHQGATCREPAAVSLGAGATRTVSASATSRNGRVEVINATDNLRASFSVQAGVPTKIEGDASIVAGAPGASQIGLELSTTTLRINNGYAGAKLIAFDYVLNG